MPTFLAFALAGTATTALACSPVYAPAIRSGLPGAPGTVAAGRVEVAGEMAVPIYQPPAGGPRLSIGVGRIVKLEAGADFFYDTWAMGWLGVRIERRWDLHPFAAIAFDIEHGVGAGAGGMHCLPPDDLSECGDDGLQWTERFAYGTYAGIGIGLHVKPFSIYGRLRGQITDADLVPWTRWGEAVGGIQFDIKRIVNLHAAVGWAGYGNATDYASGLVIDVGIGLSLPLPARRDP